MSFRRGYFACRAKSGGPTISLRNGSYGGRDNGNQLFL